MSDKKELKIRELWVSDNRKIVDLLKRFATETHNEWITALRGPSEGEKPTGDGDMVKFFVDMINNLLSMYQNEMTEIFAGLLGVTVEEYQKLPFDTDMVVIEQIKSAPGFLSFFQKACVVFNLQKVFGPVLKNLKEKLDSAAA